MLNDEPGNDFGPACCAQSNMKKANTRTELSQLDILSTPTATASPDSRYSPRHIVSGCKGAVSSLFSRVDRFHNAVPLESNSSTILPVSVLPLLFDVREEEDEKEDPFKANSSSMWYCKSMDIFESGAGLWRRSDRPAAKSTS